MSEVVAIQGESGSLSLFHTHYKAPMYMSYFSKVPMSFCSWLVLLQDHKKLSRWKGSGCLQPIQLHNS